MSQVSAEWTSLTTKAMSLLQREVELLEIVQLVGPDTLAESDRIVLGIARMLREDFLQQSAYHDVDKFCSIGKARWMLEAIMDFYHRAQLALQGGVGLEDLTKLPVVAEIARMKEWPIQDAEHLIQALMNRVRLSFEERGISYDV